MKFSERKHKDLEEKRYSRVRQLFGEILHFLWINGWASEERASKADCRAEQHKCRRMENSYTGQKVKRNSSKWGLEQAQEFFWMQQDSAKSWKALASANLVRRWQFNLKKMWDNHELWGKTLNVLVLFKKQEIPHSDLTLLTKMQTGLAMSQI